MSLPLVPLNLNDRQKFDLALNATRSISESPLAMLAWAPHLIWSHQFTYSWTRVEGWWCLFAEYPDGVYMPLPPLGPFNHEQPAPDPAGSYERVLQIVFEGMASMNGRRTVTRIENIPEELKPLFESCGYSVREKDADYLYRTQDLIGLKGDRYKSQRAACNQFMRLASSFQGGYQPSDQEACLALFDKWADQKRGVIPESGEGQDAWLSRAMLDQTRQAHLAAMMHEQELGLEGRVIRVDGEICGYTFGYERNPQVWCVLLEVTDRTIPGLAQYLFREYCRVHADYEFINTMDDSGLKRLAQSKMAYHPIRMVKNFIATVGE